MQASHQRMRHGSPSSIRIAESVVCALYKLRTVGVLDLTGQFVVSMLIVRSMHALASAFGLWLIRPVSHSESCQA